MWGAKLPQMFFEWSQSDCETHFPATRQFTLRHSFLELRFCGDIALHILPYRMATPLAEIPYILLWISYIHGSLWQTSHEYFFGFLNKRSIPQILFRDRTLKCFSINNFNPDLPITTPHSKYRRFLCPLRCFDPCSRIGFF